MLKEKIRGFFVKLAMYVIVGAMVAGLALFVIKSLYPQDDIKTRRQQHQKRLLEQPSQKRRFRKLPRRP